MRGNFKHIFGALQLFPETSKLQNEHPFGLQHLLLDFNYFTQAFTHLQHRNDTSGWIEKQNFDVFTKEFVNTSYFSY